MAAGIASSLFHPSRLLSSINIEFKTLLDNYFLMSALKAHPLIVFIRLDMQSQHDDL